MKELDISKLSKEEINRLIELQELSGLSQKKYCKKNNISLTKFSYWRLRYLKGRIELPSFEEVKIEKGLLVSLELNNCILKMELTSLSKLKALILLLREINA